MRRKNEIDIRIGKKLQNARLSAGYTQEEVAEKVNCASRYIGQLETNRTLGSIGLIIALCNLYNISLNDIYGEYLHIDCTDKTSNLSSIIGYSKLSKEYQSIIDNNIQFLNSLQNEK